MRNDRVGPEGESRTPVWKGLERLVRQRAQDFIQEIL